MNRKDKQREYYEKNKEKILQRFQGYRTKNREKIIEYGREYRKKHREELRAYDRERNIVRKEEVKKYRQKPEVKARINAYRKTPKFRGYLKEYRQRIEVKAKRKEYNARTREHINERAREYIKSHPQMIEHYKKYRKKIRQDFLSLYKKGKSCAYCGYNKYPEILQFHHKDRTEKAFNIANKVRTASALKKVKAEIDKCILLCPNCHNWLHFKENQKEKYA